MKRIATRYNDDDEDKLLKTLKKKRDQDSDDELSFGSLNNAQKKLNQLSKKGKIRHYNRDDENDNDSDDNDNDNDSEIESDSENSEPEVTTTRLKHKNNKLSGSNSTAIKSRNKHAPTESSSKKPVSKIRKIEGLNNKSTLYQDIRFDAAFGKADLHETRKNYAFLDEYRQSEIDELNKIIRDKKNFAKLSYYEQEEIKNNLQSLKSRLDTMKTRDLQHQILTDYKKEQLKNVREGKQSNPYYLKKSEQRKLLQKAKFESMKPRQREKVMERKRKRKLGKEFRELEFRQQQ